MYRTLGVAGAPPYYRISPRVGTSTSFPINYLTTTPYSVFVAEKTDAEVLAQAFGQLYTTGGILANDPPPPPKHVLAHKGRVWILSALDPRQLWFSKSFVQGEGPAYSGAFVITLEPNAVALAALDDSVVVFTDVGIYFIQGDGPNDAGQGTFAGPFGINANTGCLDPRSVVSFAGGVLFQGRDSVLYMLGRDHSVTRVGGLAQESLTLFLCSDPTGSLEPQFLVYDVRHGLWYTWSVSTDDPAKGHVIWRGLHTWCTHEHVLQESFGDQPGWDEVADDEGEPQPKWVRSSWVTPWLRVGALEGFQRAKRVTFTGRVHSPCTFEVTAQTDYASGANTTATFEVDDANPVRLQVHIARQKCSSIRFLGLDGKPPEPEVEEPPPPEEGEDPPPEPDPPPPDIANPAGMSLAGISLEIGTKKGSAKLPSTKRA